MFQTLALRVNEYLRNRAESPNDVQVKETIQVINQYFSNETKECCQKLAMDKTKMKVVLDNIWKKFENFTKPYQNFEDRLWGDLDSQNV